MPSYGPSISGSLPLPRDRLRSRATIVPILLLRTLRHRVGYLCASQTICGGGRFRENFPICREQYYCNVSNHNGMHTSTAGPGQGWTTLWVAWGRWFAKGHTAGEGPGQELDSSP